MKTMAPGPAWLCYARTLLGTREAPGLANNPTIMGWAKRLGAKVLGIAYNADSVPWCGLFVAHCMAERGLAAPPIAVRARSWAEWGVAVPPEHLAPGAVLVFQREGGGHVGFYEGEDRTHLHVLGGNQGDRVSIARIPKARLIAARWPKGVTLLGQPIMLAADAAAVTRGEA